MANMLGAAVLFLIVAGVAVVLFGMTGPVPFTNILPGFGLAVVFALGVTMLLQYAGVKQVNKLFPVSKQTAGIVGVVIVAISLYSGGFLAGLMGSVGTASFTPSSGSTVSGVTQSQCRNGISEFLLGKAATLTATGTDAWSSTPTALVTSIGYYVFKDGQYIAEGSTGGSAITNLKVGETVDIYGKSNSSYYVDDIMGVCLDGEQSNVHLVAYNAATEAQMKVTCFDSDGNTLSAAENSSNADYNLTVGSGETVAFSCKLKSNVANNGFWLKGIATASTNYTEYTRVTSAGWTSGEIPAFLSNAEIQFVDATGYPANYSGGYDKLYRVSTPIKLKQWEEVSVDFSTKAKAGSDPQFVGISAANDWQSAAVVLFLDEGTTRDATTGAVLDDVATNDEAGTELGINQIEASPIGKQTGTLIAIV